MLNLEFWGFFLFSQEIWPEGKISKMALDVRRCSRPRKNPYLTTFADIRRAWRHSKKTTWCHQTRLHWENQEFSFQRPQTTKPHLWGHCGFGSFWGSPKASHIKANQPHFRHFPRFRVRIFRVFALWNLLSNACVWNVPCFESFPASTCGNFKRFSGSLTVA